MAYALTPHDLLLVSRTQPNKLRTMKAAKDGSGLIAAVK